MTLKSAVSVGIGLFVAFVGLQNAKLIVNSDSTLLTYQHFKGETFHLSLIHIWSAEMPRPTETTTSAPIRSTSFSALFLMSRNSTCLLYTSRCV